jgi:hypothetical protein
MKNFRILVLLLLLAGTRSTPLAWGQSGQGAAAPEPSVLRIVAPQPNEKLAQTFVSVQYQQDSPVAGSSTPTYELRLDGRDPVHTTDSNYTFDGLTPGVHDLLVQIVDANNTPVRGARSEVKFVVVAPPVTTNPSGGGTAMSLPQPPVPLSSAPDLPSGNSSLPLLSVIGFGILVGGVLSALRTRPVHK